MWLINDIWMLLLNIYFIKYVFRIRETLIELEKDEFHTPDHKLLMILSKENSFKN